ncbi:MAG: DNA primase [Planctomycetota bacterium]
MAPQARFDKSDVFRVQQANDIVDLISEHVSLKRKGKEMVGLCPFHDDHRPSLYVNTAKQIFKCFACGAGGDVLKFVQMRENLTFPQAIERLANRVGINLKPIKTKQPQPAADIDPNKLAKVNAWAAKHFQQNLADPKKGKNTRDYLAQRKITPESIKKWQLGLAINTNDDLIKAAKEKNIPIKLLEQAGLIINQNGRFTDKFINRLIFTITDVTGRVIGFGARTLDETGAKYINSPTTALFDKSNALYGIEQARPHIVSSQLAVVVEGYTDCIMAHSKGCQNVVASLGTSFTTGQARILKRYAKKVVLIFDSDAAGIKAASRALEVCLAQRIDIKLASAPDGKDPCDFLLTAGKKGFQRLVENAVDVFRFKWNQLLQKFSVDGTLVDNKAAIDEFLLTIATGLYAGKLPAIDKGLIVNRLSTITGIDTRGINAILAKKVNTVAKMASYPDTGPTQPQKPKALNLGHGLFAAAQREVLEVLLSQPSLFELAKQKISPDIFDVPMLYQTATIVFETLTKNPHANLAQILAKAESVELGQCIVQLAQTGEEKGNFQARLTGALNVIQRYKTKIKKPEIKTIEDQTKFLKRVHKHTSKENRHNIGMV